MVMRRSLNSDGCAQIHHHLGEKKGKTACENQRLGNASVDVRRKQEDALASYSIHNVKDFLN